jgi:phosphoglycerate dehydrogenase-like enzyme
VGRVNILISVQSPFAIWTIPESQIERLRREFPSHVFLHARSEDEALALIADADVALSGQISPAQLAAARKLRWIHSPAAGVGGMLFPEMLARDVWITNSRGMSADTIAEHVLAVTLALFRRLPDASRAQAARTWAQDAIGRQGTRQLKGSHVVVIGLGSIGRAVAARMTALGARVSGVRRRPGSSDDPDLHVVGPEHLENVLTDADVVVISAPHTRQTRSLIGARELRAMPPRAVLVNVSRGQLVDEPLPPDSPFWTLPNVLVTPHTAGVRLDHWDAAVTLFAENLRRFERGQPLVNLVDKRAGY